MPIDPSARKNGIDLYYASPLDDALYEQKEEEKRKEEQKLRGYESETSITKAEKTPEQLKAEKKAERKAKVKGYILSVMGAGGPVGCASSA